MSNTDALQTIGEWFVGKKPTFTVQFLNEAGTLADPTDVNFVTHSPGGVETVYEYGVDAEVTKTATGIYKFEMPQLTGAHVGQWILRHNGDGAVVTSNEVLFKCLPTDFSTPLP